MQNQADILKNYHQAIDLAETLLKRRMLSRGRDPETSSADYTELVQSIVGHEKVVGLLQTEPFQADLYRPVVEEALDEVRRALFPDTARKRFISLSEPWLDPVADDTFGLDEAAEDDLLPEPFLESLRERLPEDLFIYLQDNILDKLPNWSRHFRRLTAGGKFPGKVLPVVVNQKSLRILQRYYPEGRICRSTELDMLSDLTDQQVRSVYINVYTGIDAQFPPQFLQHDARGRCRVLVRFLIEEILETTPEALLAEKDETIFIRHKLQNVYRYFNYSANRVIGNAYQDRIPPWLHSRSAVNYWEAAENRISAVRWLVEKRLKIDPRALYRHSVSRDDFAAHGLSYVYNKYYNAVTAAVGEAYPQLAPWELGKVPYDYWTAETAARAICWMITRKGWTVDELPERVRRGDFNRKTFSEFGLATLFEKRFRKNIYRAVSAAWPGRFFPWELGRVPGEFWESSANVYQASRWIARQEGIPESDIPGAIRRNDLTAGNLRKYSIGAALRKISRGHVERLFAPLFWKEYRYFLQEHKLRRKLASLRKLQQPTQLLQILLYGLSLPDVQESVRSSNSRIDRISRRMRRRALAEYD